MPEERRDAADPPIDHMPQLDGLRALAVGMVVWGHFLPQLSFGLPFGRAGVILFFVLSGFLITGILLRCRDYVRDDGQSPRRTLRQFYVRRFLRIFPLFYAALAIGAAINVSPIRRTILWHVSYLTNVYLARRGEWHAAISHFWSLAVEEQFYLVWPCCVLFVPPRRLPWLVGAVIVAAPAVRAVAIAAGMPPLSARVLTPACMDALGLGAALALVGVSARSRVLDVGLSPAAGVVALALAAGVLLDGAPDLRAHWLDSVLALVGFWLVGRAARGFRRFPGRLLAGAGAVAIGRISYGIYVIHPFVPILLGKLGIHVEVGGPHGVAVALLLAALTVGLAALSWRYYEAPLNRLKRGFPYRVVGVPPVVAEGQTGRAFEASAGDAGAAGG